MLLRLEVENFYSIRQKQVWDFRVPRTTPLGPRYGRCLMGKEQRAPHVIALFGANASGKTNFLRAITFLQRFATSSFEDYGPEEDPSLLPFNRAKYRSGMTKLAFEFSPSKWMEGRLLKEDFGEEPIRLYRYELELDHSGKRAVVVREALRWSDGGRIFSTLFDRELAGEHYTIKSHSEFVLGKDDPRKSVRRNVSLISSLVQFDHAPAKRVHAMLQYSFFSNMDIQKRPTSENLVTNFLSERPPVLNELNRKIRMIDLGIERVEIQEIDGKQVPMFYHSGLDGPQIFAFESEGTKSFYRNFLDLFMALGSGGVAVMDELDADLHPNLMSEIIRWFHSAEENPFGAQLIMSCHNASVISDLEKDEVWLSAKNEIGESTISALARFKGLRRDANLYSKYLAGEFGAVPRFG